LKCAIYDASNNLVTNGTTEEKTDLTGTVGDWTLNFVSAPTFSAQDYWLASNGNATGMPTGEGTKYNYDAGDANQQKYILNAYTSFPPATLSGGTLQAYKFSIYATYTAAGGSTPLSIESDLVIFN
jgi:hypothetical protein